MELRLWVLLAVLAAGPVIHGGEAQPLVPGIMFFGDSLVDVGNNDYINTFVKANINPYGRDFKDHVATGRFGNGKLLSDIIEASGQNLLIGANFASAGSGYYDPTARMYHLTPLSQQLEYFKEYQSKLAAVAGRNQAQSIISESLYIISAGSNDFGFNYYINPLLFLTQTAEQFSDLLVGIVNNTVALYITGARRVGAFSLAPLGCPPPAITVFGLGRSGCVPRLNNDAQRFNSKLGDVVDSLSKQHSDLKIGVLDIYTPWHSLATSPASQGFNEERRGCCATGFVDFTVLLCNPLSIGTCPNATKYVHWDSIHPSEAANRVILDSIAEGIKKLIV